MSTLLRNLTLSLAGTLALLASIPSQAQDGDLLARIKAKKEIVIGTEARYAPFEYIENGKIVGYDADLMKYVLETIPEVKVKQLDLRECQYFCV